MPRVTFLPAGVEIELPAGTAFAEGAAMAGLRLGDFPCGGKGVCGRCLVRVVSGEPWLEPTALPRTDGTVLACRSRVGTTPLVLETAAEGEGRFAVGTEGGEVLLPPGEAPTPPVSRLRLSVPPPLPGDGLSDYDRFCRALRRRLSFRHLELPLPLLSDLPWLVRQGEVTLGYRLAGDSLHAVFLSGEERPYYGVAVDLGTTTVAARLYDLESGALLGSAAGYNSQSDCGLDVISRIHYARGRERLPELRTRALESINKLIATMTAELSLASGDIAALTLAGNTTMVQLLFGVAAEFLRLHPYTPSLLSVPLYTAGELGFHICPFAPVWTAPAVGSYVGGDITAGLLCTPLASGEGVEGVSLFIDIGTNGEIVLGGDDFLLGCACSAGPAFEGGGIRHGCRASAGAIERVALSDTGEVLSCDTIGGAAPVGLCGSGAISLTAELFRHGLIDASGRFTDKAPLVEKEGRKVFVIAFDSMGRPLHFDEGDIANLVRAKAAVFSACRTLLGTVGLGFEDIGHLYVAGGFGRYLDTDDAAAIGLLPPMGERLSFLGNSALGGASMALLSETWRSRIEAAANRLTYIDLSNEPGYMEEYTAALFIPHTSFLG